MHVCTAIVLTPTLQGAGDVILLIIQHVRCDIQYTCQPDSTMYLCHQCHPSAFSVLNNEKPATSCATVPPGTHADSACLLLRLVFAW